MLICSENMASFGELLAHYVKKKGLSDTGFALVSKTTQTTVSQVKAGTRNPPPASVEKWAKYLELQGNERKEFMLSAAHARAGKLRRSNSYLRELRGQRDEAISLIQLLLDLRSQEGCKIPKEFIQRFEILKKAP